MSSTLKAIVTLAGLLVMFFAVNMIAGVGLRGARVDLTRERLFTLSSGSKNILRGLQEPIRVKLYYSAEQAQGAPDVQSFGQRVREMLEEFSRLSKGKLAVQLIDPKPFSQEEDEAQQAGLTPIRLRDRESSLYLGVVGTNSLDGREVIPFLSPDRERFLEYEMARLVYSLANPKKKVVGLVTSLPLEGGFEMDPRTQQPRRSPPWAIATELKGLFEVRRIDTGTINGGSLVDADVDLLLLVHPKGLTPQGFYAIDQFVMGGGRLLALVDPYCEADPAAQGMNQFQAMQADKSSSIGPLLNAWGVDVPSGRVAADSTLGIKMNVGGRTNPEQVTVVYYLGLNPGAMAKDDPVTSGLKLVTIGTSGVIVPKSLGATPVAGPGAPEAPATGPVATIVPLLMSTGQSQEIDVSRIQMMPDHKNLLATFAPTGKALTLAARLTGTVRSAFPEGRPPMEEGKAPPAPDATRPHLAESKGPINAIVVADADFAADAFWVENTVFGPIKRFNNADFIVSAVDNLLGSADLISVRARGQASRPFTRVDEMEKEAELKFRAEESVLQQKLGETEQKLAELERKRPEGENQALLLTPEQVKEIDNFRNEKLETRKKLRRVQSDLRAEAEALGTRLKFINIGLMPCLVALGAVGLGAMRAARAGRARRAVSKAE